LVSIVIEYLDAPFSVTIILFAIRLTGHLFVETIVPLLQELVVLEEKQAVSVSSCRAKDEAKGKEVFGSQYGQVHSSVEEDGVVQMVRQRAAQCAESVAKLISGI
jgi:hypothetical protein